MPVAVPAGAQELVRVWPGRGAVRACRPHPTPGPSYSLPPSPTTRHRGPGPCTGLHNHRGDTGNTPAPWEALGQLGPLVCTVQDPNSRGKSTRKALWLCPEG